MTGEPTYLLWLGQLVMLSVPGYFVLQAWFGRFWSGHWRVAALVPLAGMVPAVSSCNTGVCSGIEPMAARRHLPGAAGPSLSLGRVGPARGGGRGLSRHRRLTARGPPA